MEWAGAETRRPMFHQNNAATSCKMTEHAQALNRYASLSKSLIGDMAHLRVPK